MTSSEQVAGHPIASEYGRCGAKSSEADLVLMAQVRVGGRRLSQSHPLRSPSKAAQSASPSTSPEEATNIQQQPVADYPRPRSAAKDEVDHDAGAGLNGEGAAGASNEDGAKGGNRKERRRQERNKKDRYQTEEDKMHNSMQKSDFPFDVKGGGGNKDTKSKRAPSATGGGGGGGGPRITQPMGKFMA